MKPVTSLPSIREVLGEFFEPTHRPRPLPNPVPAPLPLPSSLIKTTGQHLVPGPSPCRSATPVRVSITCNVNELKHDEGKIVQNDAGEKMYPCPRCQLVFRRQAHRIRHLRIHTGQRPFQCNEPGCGKSFNRMDNLRKHLVLHRQPSLNASRLW